MRRRRRKAPVSDLVALPILVASATIAAADLARRAYRHTQIFCPSREPVRSWNPADYGIPAGAASEYWIDTPDGEILHAWYCQTENPKASGVFCHGNTGNITTSADVIPHLLRAGFNVLFFDYRGFGRSSGRPTVGGVVADGITAARFHDKIRPQEIPSVLYGYSLGGAVAAQVIRRHAFDALILQSTFTSLPQITRVLFPRFPLHLLAGDVFDTISVMEKLGVPLLILHGTNDEVVPCWMAHALFDACRSAKQIHCVNGALHKDMFIRDPEAMVDAIRRFLTNLPNDGHAHPIEQPPRIEQLTHSILRTLRRMARRRAAVIASAAAEASGS